MRCELKVVAIYFRKYSYQNTEKLSEACIAPIFLGIREVTNLNPSTLNNSCIQLHLKNRVDIIPGWERLQLLKRPHLLRTK